MCGNNLNKSLKKLLRNCHSAALCELNNISLTDLRKKTVENILNFYNQCTRHGLFISKSMQNNYKSSVTSHAERQKRASYLVDKAHKEPIATA